MIAVLLLFADESKAHKAKANMEKAKKPYPKRVRTAAICEGCGEVFSRESQHERDQRLCPDKCQQIHRRELNRERQRRHRARLRGA